MYVNVWMWPLSLCGHFWDIWNPFVDACGHFAWSTLVKIPFMGQGLGLGLCICELSFRVLGIRIWWGGSCFGDYLFLIGVLLLTGPVLIAAPVDYPAYELLGFIRHLCCQLHANASYHYGSVKAALSEVNYCYVNSPSPCLVFSRFKPFVNQAQRIRVCLPISLHQENQLRSVQGTK